MSPSDPVQPVARPAPTRDPISERRPRMIASDLDGTIIGYDHTRTGYISARTVAAFQAAHDAGIQVVFVTGRPIRWLTPLADALGHAGPVICSNGAVVYDLGAGEVLESRPMAWEAVVRVRQLISRLDPTASFGAETLDGYHLDAGFVPTSAAEHDGGASVEDASSGGVDPGHGAAGDGGAAGGRTGSSAAAPTGSAEHPMEGLRVGRTLDEVLPPDPRVVKFLAKTSSRNPDVFLAEVRELLGDLAAVTHSAPGVALLEISRPEVNKAATLAQFAADHGIGRHDVVAFGDMPNDVEMIDWAGAGYAVASGHPLLVEAADGVTGACDDDGVAVVIERLLALD